MSSQKTRHQKLNSSWVMNSLGDKLSTQQRYPPKSLKYKNMYACIINKYEIYTIYNIDIYEIYMKYNYLYEI